MHTNPLYNNMRPAIPAAAGAGVAAPRPTTRPGVFESWMTKFGSKVGRKILSQAGKKIARGVGTNVGTALGPHVGSALGAIAFPGLPLAGNIGNMVGTIAGPHIGRIMGGGIPAVFDGVGKRIGNKLGVYPGEAVGRAVGRGMDYAATYLPSAAAPAIAGAGAPRIQNFMPDAYAGNTGIYDQERAIFGEIPTRGDYAVEPRLAPPRLPQRTEWGGQPGATAPYRPGMSLDPAKWV